MVVRWSVRKRRLPRAAALLAALVVVVMAGGPTSARAQPAARSIQLSGVVQTPAGSPIPGATVTVGDQQLAADDQGRWQGAVPFAAQLRREYATAPGYITRGWHDLDLPSPNAIAPPLEDTLESIFDPDAASYTQLPASPPTVTAFITDTGVSRSQEVPASTTTLTVSGTVGARDSQPIVRGDAYLAHPDDFVDRLAVTVQGDTFSVEFPIASGPGAYRVEINDTTGAAIINVPVFVGVPYQPEPPIWPDPADLAGDGPVTRALAALQNVRQAHGLAPYAIDPRLQQVAQDHVDDMVANHWICHCWADGSSLLDHLRAAGITPGLIPVPGHPNQFTVAIGNGITTEPGAAGIRALFTSPGHRLDLLGTYSHIGIAYGGQIADGTSRLSIVYALENNT